MIDIIQEKRKPSFGQQFSQAVGGALDVGNQMMQAKQAEKLNQQSIEAGKQLLGMDLSGFDPETRKALLVEGLKQQGKGQIQQGKQSFLSDLLNKGKSQSQDIPDQQGFQDQNDFEEMQEPNKRLPYSHEQIAAATIVDPNLAREMRAENDSIAKEIGAEKKAKEKRLSNLRAETAPIKQKIIDRAELSREGIRNKQHLLNIIDRGELDDPTFAAFASNLPFNLGKRMLSDDTVEYKGGLVDEFGDLKNIFKGAIRVKEVEIYEDKLPDIYLTDSQKKAILKSRINSSKVDLIREEAAEEVEEKFPELTALQFNKKVEQMMKPKMDALFNSTWNEQKAIIDQAEQRKSIPLDPQDPEDKEIMKQIFKEAGGDKLKAKKLAEKKGYSVKGVK